MIIVQVQEEGRTLEKTWDNKKKVEKANVSRRTVQPLAQVFTE